MGLPENRHARRTRREPWRHRDHFRRGVRRHRLRSLEHRPAKYRRAARPDPLHPASPACRRHRRVAAVAGAGRGKSTMVRQATVLANTPHSWLQKCLNSAPPSMQSTNAANSCSRQCQPAPAASPPSSALRLKPSSGSVPKPKQRGRAPSAQPITTHPARPSSPATPPPQQSIAQ